MAARLEALQCRVAPSSIHGVGLFALRDMPAGHTLDLGGLAKGRFVREAALRARGVPEPVLRALQDHYCTRPGLVFLPRRPARVPLASYLNHASPPNLQVEEDGAYTTLRRVRAGEELTEDYLDVCGRDYVPRPGVRL